MHRLAGSDAGFLFIESPTQSSTCVDVLVLDPPTTDAPWTTEALADHLETRLPHTPALRRRLLSVPLGLGHPVLADDPHVRVADHVGHLSLPAPGDDDQLHEAVADLLPLRLDRRRPLWRVWLVDGLSGGRQALLFAFHHALADGAGLVATLERLVDDRFEEAAASATAPARPVPGPLLLLVTLWSQLLAWVALPALAFRTWRRLRAVGRRRERAAVPVPPMTAGAPRTVLNRSADATREFATATVPMHDLRRVRDAAGTSLSDVVLAVLAGGLRTYLTDRLELPEEPLVVNVPVGLGAAPGDTAGDTAGDADGEGAGEGVTPRLTGNRFANYYAYLATDEPDPRRRLLAVAAAQAEARRQLEILGPGTLASWLDRIPPVLGGAAAARMSARRRAEDAAPDFNLLVSNMRAPGGPWTMRGRRVTRFAMSGPAADGAGLNVTVTGYADVVTFALVVNPAAVPAPVELANRISEALQEQLRAHGCVPDDHEVA